MSLIIQEEMNLLLTGYGSNKVYINDNQTIRIFLGNENFTLIDARPEVHKYYAQKEGNYGVGFMNLPCHVNLYDTQDGAVFATLNPLKVNRPPDFDIARRTFWINVNSQNRQLPPVKNEDYMHLFEIGGSGVVSVMVVPPYFFNEKYGNERNAEIQKSLALIAAGQ